jgi:hypothetical protein
MCDDTSGCVMQFWPPGDDHMLLKHVEAWNKLIVKEKFCSVKLVNYWDKFPRTPPSLAVIWSSFLRSDAISTKWRHSVCQNVAYLSGGSTVLSLLCRAVWNRKFLRNVDNFLRLLEKQKPPKGRFDCYFFPHNIRISCLLCLALVHPSPIVVGWILNSLDVIMIIESILLSPWRAALRSSSLSVQLSHWYLTQTPGNVARGFVLR